MNKHQLLRKTDLPSEPDHLWFGVTRRDLVDCGILAAIAMSCVGLMVLGAL